MSIPRLPDGDDFRKFVRSPTAEAIVAAGALAAAVRYKNVGAIKRVTTKILGEDAVHRIGQVQRVVGEIRPLPTQRAMHFVKKFGTPEQRAALDAAAGFTREASRNTRSQYKGRLRKLKDSLSEKKNALKEHQSLPKNKREPALIKELRKDIRELNEEIKSMKVESQTNLQKVEENLRTEIDNHVERIAIKQADQSEKLFENTEKALESILILTFGLIITSILTGSEEDMTVPQGKKMINEEIPQAIKEKITELREKNLQSLDKMKSHLNSLKKFQGIYPLLELLGHNVQKTKEQANIYAQLIEDFISGYEKRIDDLQIIEEQIFKMAQEEFDALSQQYHIAEEDFGELVQESKKNSPNPKVLERHRLDEDSYREFLADHSLAKERIKAKTSNMIEENPEIFKNTTIHFFDISEQDANAHTASASNLKRFILYLSCGSAFVPEITSVQLPLVKKILGNGSMYNGIKKIVQKSPALMGVAVLVAVLGNALGLDPKENDLKSYIKELAGVKEKEESMLEKILSGSTKVFFEFGMGALKTFLGTLPVNNAVMQDVYDTAVEGFSKALEKRAKPEILGKDLKDTPEQRAQIRREIMDLLPITELFPEERIESLNKELEQFQARAKEELDKFASVPMHTPSAQFVLASNFLQSPNVPNGALHLDPDFFDKRFDPNFFSRNLPGVGKIPESIDRLHIGEPPISTVVGVDLVSQGVFSVMDRINNPRARL